MKRRIISTLLLIVFFSNAFSQITINENDMPSANDIYITSTTNSINSYYDSTGTNYYWDFSDLTPNNQKVDTFVSSFSTNAAYAVVFFNTIAVPGRDFPNMIPQITITDVYDFFKLSSSKYVKKGMGAKVNSVPMPMQFDNDMMIYTLPLNYGNVDSSTSSYGLSIPNFGYYGQTIKRVNYTEGWGTVVTPFGIFNALKVRSELQYTDTFYYDSFGYGTTINRNETEYQWISNNMGIPVLTVTKANFQTTVVYQDSLISTDNNKILKEKSEIKIFPNPATESLNIDGISGNIKIFNNNGNLVWEGNVEESIKIDLSKFSSGLYYIESKYSSAKFCIIK